MRARVLHVGVLRVGRPLVFVLGLIACAMSLRLLPSGEQDLSAWAKDLGVWRFCLIATMACASGVPRQAIAFAGGYAHGLVLGTALALGSETLACLLNVVWARSLARNWLQSRLPQRWLARLHQAFATQPFATTLSLRLLPVGNNLLLNLAAGLLRVPIARFVLASAVGYIPLTIIFALLGSGVHVHRGVELAAGVVLFALSILTGWLVLKRQRRES